MGILIWEGSNKDMGEWGLSWGKEVENDKVSVGLGECWQW